MAGPLPYPWGFLRRVSEDAVRQARRIRPALERCAEPRRVARALGEIVASDVSFTLRRLLPTAAPMPEQALVLECDDLGLTLGIDLEAQLAMTLLARALGRAPALMRPDAPLDAALRGALSAVLVEAARRAGSEYPLTARSGQHEGAPGLRADATIFVDGKPFRATVWAARSEEPTRDGDHGRPLSDLGGVPLGIPIVAASSLVEWRELDLLEPNDVFVPGAWFHQERRAGESAWDAVLRRAVLAAPRSERGVLVERSPGGPWCFGGALSLCSEEHPGTACVRVEVGTVVRSARDWDRLCRGDTLDPDVQTQGAVIRIAGRAFACGALVTVGKELGIRVTTRARRAA